MANNSAPSSLWNFSMPLIVPTAASALDHRHASSASNNVGERKQRTLRLSINARERRRMHDLNDALDELRSVVGRPPRIRCLLEPHSIV
jgi:hypothetical protein